MKIISLIGNAIFKTLLLSLAIVAQVNFTYAQSQGAIIPNGKATFLDSNGNPLSSGKVFYYVPSTTTPKATYQDVNQTISNTNPVVLDAAGRSPAQVWGAGNYRQLVQDQNGNVVWDVTTSTNGTGNVTTSTGDGDLVGTIKPWAGVTAPNQYMFTAGQQVSRSTFSFLFSAITSTQSVSCTNGNNVVGGLTDTTNFWIGMTVEIACVSGGVTTVTAKTLSTVTLAVNANATQTTNAVFFPWGNGNGTTTFTLPDLRGLIPTGNNNMGGTASSNLTATYFGATNPNSIGALGGGQNVTLSASNLPTITSTNPTQSIVVSPNGKPNLAGTAGAITNVSATGGGALNSLQSSSADWTAVGNMSGNNAISVTSTGTSSTPFGIISPSKTVNYIIKVTPDANSATASGVTDINGMTGSIGCGSQLNCVGNIIDLNCAIFTSSTKGCVPASSGGTINFLRADGVFAPPTSGGRIILVAPTTFYFSLTGNDVTGTGTSGNPWRHLAYAYSFVQSHYDSGGQTVTFHTNDTSVTFPDCFVATGPLVGQLSAGSVIIDYNGNNTEGTVANCAGGNIYAMGANGNASYTFENVIMSVCGTANTAGNGNDMVNVGQGSTLFVGPGVTFGCAFSQWNQASINGILVILNNYTIQAKNVTTTGTWASSGNTVSVTNATGILLGFGSLTVGGGNDCFVTSSSPTLPTSGAATLTLSRDINDTNQTCSFTTSGTGASITFNSGGNGHWGIGAAGQVECATNNVPNTQRIAVQGNPMYQQAFVYALQLSQINCGSEWFVNGNAYGPPFLAQGLSLLYGQGMGLPYWPGSGYNGTLTLTTTAGSTSATLSAGGGTYVVNGAGISDSLTATNCTTTTGSGTLTGCTNGTNCFPGARVVNTANVPTGFTVASSTSTTVTFAAGQAAQSNGSGVAITCTGHYLTWNSLTGTYIVSGGSGTAITLSQPALVSGSGIPVTIGGLVTSGSQIN